MADSLSITASIVGITVPALHDTRLLLEDLQWLKNAPKIIKRLTNDMHSVYAALELLEDNKVEEMNLSNDDEEAATLAEGKAEALRKLKEGHKVLNASRKLLDKLLSKAQEDAVAMQLQGTRAVQPL
ncbi:hypothetical protein B0O99DRAFT_686797 [Bisporella sp. PMI_857]|nr:hypothetical protein B0O99DRAFT_686797 [Bisporella sp. PMI_857]